MTENTKYINAVESVRVEKGMCHFTMGEWGPTRSGEPEFSICLKAVMTQEDAYKLFDFMLTKVSDTKGNEPIKIDKSNNSRMNEPVTSQPQKNPEVKHSRIEIAMSIDDNDHGGSYD